MIGAVVLGAGSSLRFGGDKRLARLASGQATLERTVELALGAFDSVLLALRPDDDGLAQELTAAFGDARLNIFKAPDSHLGMGHSLANAIAEVQGWEGAFICLGDMPFVKPETLAELKAALAAAEEGAIVLPMFRGWAGHPVGFHRARFPALAGLQGDRGARSLVEAHRKAVVEVTVQDLGILRDIDTPKDLAPR